MTRSGYREWCTGTAHRGRRPRAPALVTPAVTVEPASAFEAVFSTTATCNGSEFWVVTWVQPGGVLITFAVLLVVVTWASAAASASPSSPRRRGPSLSRTHSVRAVLRQHPGIAHDGCPYRLTAPNLAAGLIKAGKSGVGYAEELLLKYLLAHMQINL